MGLLRPLPLGDVAEVADHAADGRVGQQVGDGALQPPPGAVLVPDAVVHAPAGTGLPPEFVEQATDPLPVVRVDQLECRAADEVLGGVAQGVRDGRAGVPHDPVSGDDGDDVPALLDQGTEPLLVPFGPPPGGVQDLGQGADRDPAGDAQAQPHDPPERERCVRGHQDDRGGGQQPRPEAAVPGREQDGEEVDEDRGPARSSDLRDEPSPLAVTARVSRANP